MEYFKLTTLLDIKGAAWRLLPLTYLQGAQRLLFGCFLLSKVLFFFGAIECWILLGKRLVEGTGAGFAIDEPDARKTRFKAVHEVEVVVFKLKS